MHRFAPTQANTALPAAKTSSYSASVLSNLHTSSFPYANTACTKQGWWDFFVVFILMSINSPIHSKKYYGSKRTLTKAKRRKLENKTVMLMHFPSPRRCETRHAASGAMRCEPRRRRKGAAGGAAGFLERDIESSATFVMITRVKIAVWLSLWIRRGRRPDDSVLSVHPSLVHLLSLLVFKASAVRLDFLIITFSLPVTLFVTFKEADVKKKIKKSKVKNKLKENEKIGKNTREGCQQGRVVRLWGNFQFTQLMGL